VTPSISISTTPSITPSISISRTPSITPSISISRTPSVTPSISISRTPSVTPSISISKTPSISISKTPSVTPSTSVVAAQKYGYGDFVDVAGMIDCGGGGFDFGFFQRNDLIVTIYDSSCSGPQNATQTYTFTFGVDAVYGPDTKTVVVNSGTSGTTDNYLVENSCFGYYYYVQGLESVTPSITGC
jgi:hypothetical protein